MRQGKPAAVQLRLASTVGALALTCWANSLHSEPADGRKASTAAVDQGAREEAGVSDVFLFPAHDLAGGYNLPHSEVEAYERVIRPRVTQSA